jgi:hypothetical protein
MNKMQNILYRSNENKQKKERNRQKRKKNAEMNPFAIDPRKKRKRKLQ